MSEKIQQYTDNFYDELKINNPSLRPKTLDTYTKLLVRLTKLLLEKEYDIRLLGNIPFCLVHTPVDVCDLINEMDIADVTKKNYYSTIMSLMRGQGIENPGIFDNSLEIYREQFEELKQSINAVEELQEPKKKELQIKELTIQKLKKGLNFHRKKLRKDPYDLDSALMLMVGTINTELCLRNEPANMVMTSEYLEQDEYPKTNFLWVCGRNKKVMVIRDNKVREGGKDPEKALEITGQFNSIINKYIKALENHIQSRIADVDMLPLIFKSKGDGSNISGPGYVALVKRTWQHMDLIMTSTLIRKVFAIDIRKKYGGKYTEEKKACDKLDHTMAVHNKNYVLFFE